MFSVRRIIEGCEAAVRGLYMVFVDLEGAFDGVPREVIWWALVGGGVVEREVLVMVEMCTGAGTAVRVNNRFCLGLVLDEIRTGVG